MTEPRVARVNEQTEQTVNNVEKTLAVHFPEDYRQFLLNVNGHYPLRRTFSFLTAENLVDEELDCLFGIQTETDDLVENQSRTKLQEGLIAIGRDPKLRPICMDCRPGETSGTVYFNAKYKEEARSPENDLHRIADSFSDLLSKLWDGHITPNFQSEVFKLLYKDQLMGIITDVGTDQPFFMGCLEVTPAYEAFRAGFESMTDEGNEDRLSENPPIDLMNWFIDDDNSVKILAHPAVQDNGTFVCWRW